MARKKRRREAYIGVLGVNSSDQIGETMLLFVFVGDEDGVGIESTLVDLKACFVGNPVAVSEGRCSRMVVSGHIMDGRRRKGAGREGGNKLCVRDSWARRRRRRRHWSKRRILAEK